MKQEQPHINTEAPEPVTSERPTGRMPEFNVADIVTSLLRRVSFVGRPHITGMQMPRRSAQVET